MGFTGRIRLAGASFGQPVITTQPQDQTNAVGTTAALWVEATNSAPLAYQWQKFVSPNWSELISRTNTALILTNVQASDAADYRIVVTNVAGAVTSTVAHLYVIVPPVITSQPVDKAVALGTAASFSVSVTGTAPLSYQWRQDGVDQAGATTRIFTRSSAQLTNAGGYAVVVTNLAGAVTSRVAQLSVALGRVYTNAQGAQLPYRLFAPVNY